MAIYIINGPPGAGKDKLGEYIQNRIISQRGVAEIQKFAEPLDAIAKSILPREIVDEYHLWREEKKDDPLPGYNTTLRQILIDISENVVKPNFGQDYFGLKAHENMLVSQLKDSESHTHHDVIFTDSGFQVEFDKFMDLNDSKQPVVLIKLSREGATFQGDSRDHVVSNGRCVELHVTNDSALSDLLKTARELVGSWGSVS